MCGASPPRQRQQGPSASDQRRLQQQIQELRAETERQQAAFAGSLRQQTESANTRILALNQQAEAERQIAATAAASRMQGAYAATTGQGTEAGALSARSVRPRVRRRALDLVITPSQGSGLNIPT